MSSQVIMILNLTILAKLIADAPLPPPFVTLARTHEDRSQPVLGPTGEIAASYVTCRIWYVTARPGRT